MIPALAKLMQNKYVSFILNGDPNTGSKDLDWPRYDESSTSKNPRQILKFGDNKNEVITDPLKQSRCDLWQDAPYNPPDDDDDFVVEL